MVTESPFSSSTFANNGKQDDGDLAERISQIGVPLTFLEKLSINKYDHLKYNVDNWECLKYSKIQIS